MKIVPQTPKKSNPEPEPTEPEGLINVQDFTYMNWNGEPTTLSRLDKVIGSLSRKLTVLTFLLERIQDQLPGGTHEIQAAFSFAIDSLKEEQEKLYAIQPENLPDKGYGVMEVAK